MIQKEHLLQALENLQSWFLNSTVMEPNNGTWGVAERIYNVSDTELKKRVFDTFNSFTDYGKWSVIESRRPDCNFQTAYLFLLLARMGFHGADKIAENLLEYLYCRSGLLNREPSKRIPLGVWNWSHTKWSATLWMDDNAWTLAIPLLIQKHYPSLAHFHKVREWSAPLAQALADGFAASFHAGNFNEVSDCYHPDGLWYGRPQLPHWGSLVCMALSIACSEGIESAGSKEIIREYHEYVRDSIDTFNASELAYALIGCSAAARVFRETLYLDLQRVIAERLVMRIEPETGNIPAEHYESPCGPLLVDTIYTLNWVLLGLQTFLPVSLPEDEKKFRTAYEKMLSLVLRIQDKSPERQFNGCWRGMYDLNTNSWGGGDSYEGGCGSIYSGWTNAPIGIVLASEYLSINPLA